MAWARRPVLNRRNRQLSYRAFPEFDLGQLRPSGVAGGLCAFQEAAGASPSGSSSARHGG